jgi:hypothetical protein
MSKDPEWRLDADEKVDAEEDLAYGDFGLGEAEEF